MRASKLALRTAGAVVICVAVPVCGATAAQAGDGVRVTVTPSSVAPGGAVEIKVEGCEGDRATVSSEAFTRAAKVDGDRHSPLYGDAEITSSAKAGRYDVDVRCDHRDHDGVGSIRVAEAGGSGHHDPSTHPTPEAPVPAGGGGTADLAATGDRATGQAAGSAGPGVPYTVTGLVLAAVAAVTVAVGSGRRRRTAAGDAD